MNDVVRELLLHSSGSKQSESLQPIQQAIGNTRCGLAIAKLALALTGYDFPQDVDTNWEWCKDLQIALRLWPALGATFVIANGQLNFAPEISEAERSEIMAFIDASFRHEPMV